MSPLKMICSPSMGLLGNVIFAAVYSYDKDFFPALRVSQYTPKPARSVATIPNTPKAVIAPISRRLHVCHDSERIQDNLLLKFAAQNSDSRALRGHKIPVLQGLIWRLSTCIVMRLEDCRGRILGLELDRSPHFSMSYAVVIKQMGTERHKIVMPQTAFQTVKAWYRRLVLCNVRIPARYESDCVSACLLFTGTNQAGHSKTHHTAN
jgi:hypothetical protein